MSSLVSFDRLLLQSSNDDSEPEQNPRIQTQEPERAKKPKQKGKRRKKRSQPEAQLTERQELTMGDHWLASTTTMEHSCSSEYLHNLLFQPNDDFPVIVAIHFEGSHIITSDFQLALANMQVGISILDTEHLDRGPTNFNFIKGDVPSAKRAYNFYFGNKENIQVNQVLDKIRGCLAHFHRRRIVLISHGLDHELRILNILGFFHVKYNIVAKLDTRSLAIELRIGDCELQKLLLHLDFPPAKERVFRNAGNFANFTLRAFILLGLKTIVYPMKLVDWNRAEEFREIAVGVLTADMNVLKLEQAGKQQQKQSQSPPEPGPQLIRRQELGAECSITKEEILLMQKEIREARTKEYELDQSSFAKIANQEILSNTALFINLWI